MGSTKAKARKLLTEFINQIADEIHHDPEIIDEEAVMVTKAEKLARFIWKSALGYTETVNIVNKETGELTRKTVPHPPDKKYVDILYDRMEGRVPTVEIKDTDSRPTVADRVSREGKGRLNKLAKNA